MIGSWLGYMVGLLTSQQEVLCKLKSFSRSQSKFWRSVKHLSS